LKRWASPANSFNPCDPCNPWSDRTAEFRFSGRSLLAGDERRLASKKSPASRLLPPEHRRVFRPRSSLPAEVACGNDPEIWLVRSAPKPTLGRSKTLPYLGSTIRQKTRTNERSRAPAAHRSAGAIAPPGSRSEMAGIKAKAPAAPEVSPPRPRKSGSCGARRGSIT
jgi:hypothetical protein